MPRRAKVYTKTLAKTQGWGGPAVQYQKSTPVLGNLGTVTDLRSYFYDSGIVRTFNEDLYRVPSPPIYEDWWTGGHFRNFPIPGNPIPPPKAPVFKCGTILCT